MQNWYVLSMIYKETDQRDEKMKEVFLKWKNASQVWIGIWF